MFNTAKADTHIRNKIFCIVYIELLNSEVFNICLDDIWRFHSQIFLWSNVVFDHWCIKFVF